MCVCQHAYSYICPVQFLNLLDIIRQTWQNSTDLKDEVFINCMKIDASLKRVTVMVFPHRERWKNDLTRHQETFYKLVSCHLKAPSTGKGSVGTCWEDLWTLGQKSIENSPSLVTVLLKILRTHCPFDFLSCLKKKKMQSMVLEGKLTKHSLEWDTFLLPPVLTWLLFCNLVEYSKDTLSSCFLLTKLKQALGYIAFSFLM